MIRFAGTLFLSFLLAACAIAQIKPKAGPVKKLPRGVPAVPAVAADEAALSDRTYSSRELGFSISFPEGWAVTDEDFESEVKKSGIDLELKAPEDLGSVSRIRMDRSLKNVSVLVTAFRSTNGTGKSAVIRVSAENLSANPQIKDAIDYFDAIRNEYARMNLPKDLKYSETQAEQLGKQQFAYLDLSSDAGKKRLYATVRRGYAILFSLSYTADEDLQAMRRVLSTGNFAFK